MNEGFKIYEIAFLLEGPDHADELEKILVDNDAKIIFRKNPEKINLAYPVKKETQAFFGYFNFKSKPEIIENIIKLIKQNKKILRVMIIAKDQRFLTENLKNEKENLKSQINLLNLEDLNNEDLEKKIEEILLKNQI